MINLRRKPAISFSIIALLAFVSPLPGDVVKLTDGREFEGVARSQTGDKLQIDTVISGVRAKLTLKRADVASIEKKPLPEGFFEASDPEEPVASSQQSGPTLYLEIPIVGRFRDTVFAHAVRSALSYANAKKIGHVVFTIDSPGGAIDEAGAIYRAIAQYEKNLTYHAIIKNCTGDALVVPFLCDTLHLQPGGTVGGSETWDKLPRKYVKKDAQVARAQIADDLVNEAQKRGRKGDLIRAMVDPADSLAAWRDKRGEVLMAPTPPTDLSADQLIFECKPGAVLLLNYEQATSLGIPTLKGGAEELGTGLGLPNWHEESSFGRDTMNRAVAAQRKKASGAQARFEDDVTSNIQMRQTTRHSIEENLKQAATWNPTTASYKTLTAYSTMYWNPSATWDTHIWTPDSRRRWQNRTEACLYYLDRARSGIEAMIRLEKQAVSLGLSPSYKEGDLQAMLEDVNIKIEMLKRNQNRVGE